MENHVAKQYASSKKASGKKTSSKKASSEKASNEKDFVREVTAEEMLLISGGAPSAQL